ncbi:alpha/beta hydrolase, partial [Kribbella turkmenica]
GGWVSQLAALDHPSRVGSLVLVSTRATGHGQADADLPEVSPRLLQTWAEADDEPDWSDDDAVLDYLVGGERSLAGPLLDEASVREVCRSFLRRTGDVRAALTNHPIADQGPRWRERLSQITAPTLVLHGERDPLFPPANAVRLAAEIPGARLRVVPEVGHELPRKAWSGYVDAIAGQVIPC